jgi:hypothetical protein
MPGVLELTDEIELLLEWKLRVNELIKQVNEMSKFKMYNLVK